MDYYKTLGIDQSASDDDIKKAYRKLAMKHHPDRGGDENTFKQIQEAYNVLSDAAKRAEYDNPPSQGPNRGFDGFPPGFEDLFSQFGFNGPFGFNRRPEPQRNRSMNIGIEITLEEAHKGKEILANVHLPTGREQQINVRIPAGIRNGTTLRLAGLGDDSIPNSPRGDIHLTVQVSPHAIFKRENDDLLMDIRIDAIDAMLGSLQDIKTIDGKTLELTIKPGTQPGTILSLSGYGMPAMQDSRFVGRLLVTVGINIPTMLTDNQKNKLKEIFSK